MKNVIPLESELTPERGNRLLNIGSSSLDFRTKVQPHINENIFIPLEKNAIKVVHTDIQDDAGVDMVGDLLYQDFIKVLEKEQFEIILCSNLLEHLEEIDPVCQTIEKVLKKKGYAIITVPYNYPYHLDPIDNMFRPSVEQILKKFPSLKIIEGKIIKASSFNKKLNKKESNYFQKLVNQPRILIIILIRVFMPFYKFKTWKSTMFGVLRIFKTFSVTCVVLKKE